MNGYLADTNVVSELFHLKPNPRVEAWLLNVSENDLFISCITLLEVCHGIVLLPAGKRRTDAQTWLDGTVRPWFNGRILPVEERIAERCAMLLGESRRMGRTMSFLDALIAGTASVHELTLVTRNVKDFEHLGLKILNPWD